MASSCLLAKTTSGSGGEAIGYVKSRGFSEIREIRGLYNTTSRQAIQFPAEGHKNWAVAKFRASNGYSGFDSSSASEMPKAKKGFAGFVQAYSK